MTAEQATKLISTAMFFVFWAVTFGGLAIHWVRSAIGKGR